MTQPPGFEYPKAPNHVYKLHKALYALQKVRRTWYEMLISFLVAQGFKRGRINTTLFTKRKEGDLHIIQLYVDDIIFGYKNRRLCEEIYSMMSKEFEISMMAELNFFLGLQVKQEKNCTFINQSKYEFKPVKSLEWTKPRIQRSL